MPPMVEPILLWGFCFTTQQKQRFNQQWACAWLTSWYTDERHLDSVEDHSKRREIRYGNNIAVLFRALLHLRRFYGQDSLWPAIGRGFNTNQTIARATAEILTEARRAQRGKPAKDVSDTARAADDWIDFLDSQRIHPRAQPDPGLFTAAAAFFDSQEKKWLNAARVPTNPRTPLQINTTLRPAPGIDETNPSPRLPPTPIKPESPTDPADRHRLLWSTHKRSASPPSSDRSPKSRRLNHDVNGQSRVGSDSQRQHDQAKEPHSDSRRTSTATKLAPPPPNQPKAPSNRDDAPKPSRPQINEEVSALKARIADLESKLSAAQKRQSAATANPPGQARRAIDELKKDMDSATNAIGTMMESMHDIVDGFTLLQESVSALSRQQSEIATALPPTGKLDALLHPIQAVADSVRLLREEVSELKKQAAGQHAALPSLTTQHNTEIKSLLQGQNSRIDKLVRDMANMQTQMSSPLPRQAPQNLRQALATVEREIKVHLDIVQGFYHKLDGSHGASRMVTEQTADLLAMLQQSVHIAQMGQQSC
ncbi:hypothetical protein MMYC01_202780 [Madurella mycetomatis]|uniref:Uncharacterized protein n=1 Tax=Madurella mycetomatis TaxID=100816 RepID=A0A175WC32_9PEZI|nr:hypothetical protein MMYC01_202780 [Madurella mycetomatis]